MRGTFKPGDRVLHRVTGQLWLIGAVYDDGRFIPLGWPCSMEQVSDCDLVEAATEEKSRWWLEKMAETPNDPRGEWARRELAREGEHR